MKFTLFLLTLVLSSLAFAGGDGATSLIAPAVNVAILLSAIIYKLKTPAKEFFNDKSGSIKDLLESAANKAKEAEFMLQAQKNKQAGAEEEISKLESENKTMLNEFESDYTDSIQTRIVNLKDDAGQKIEAEKKEMLSELNANLLDLVISKAKTQINTDKNLANSATKNIVEGL